MGLFDGLFGKKKKSQEDISGKPMYAWEAPSYPLVSETLKSRMAGKGVGYRPEILSGVTSAYAKQRRGALENYEIPGITSAASARGLGRSSIATSQIGRAEQEAGRDIEERVAQMALADEEQRRKEINQALADTQNLLGTEIGSSQVRGDWERGVSAYHAGQSARRKAEDQAFTDRLIATGATLGGGLIGGPTGMAIGSQLGRVATGGGSDMSDLALLQEFKGKPATTVAMTEDDYDPYASTRWRGLYPGFGMSANRRLG